METYRTGEGPAAIWNYKGTLAEIRATPGPEGSLGHPTDSRLELRYRNGAWEALENGAVDLDTGKQDFPSDVYAPSVESKVVKDPITGYRIPDPRKGKSVKATLIRGTVAVDIKDAEELLVFGSNATTATNSMSATLMDATVSKAVLTEGAALSSAMVSIPHPVGESASVIAATNAAGFAVTMGA